MAWAEAAAFIAEHPEIMKIAIAVGPKVIKHMDKDRGSKVKKGTFKECSIGFFGDKTCIVVDDAAGVIVPFDSNTVRKYKFTKEKFRPAAMHTYYYYHITFKDGNECDVRMREKYVEAMQRYC